MPGVGRARDPLLAIDLFAGAGGLSEGLRQVGYEVALALDWDADSCETYKANHPATHVEHAGITDLSPKDIARRAGGDVDLIVGGPSCQGFSTARKERWHDPASDRNRLWKHMLGVVGVLRPRAFLIENVPGLVLWKKGNFGGDILREFRNLGYTVGEPRIVLAADYGVPQRRRRLFIVGVLGRSEFQFPEVTHLGGWRRDTLQLWEKRRAAEGLHRHLSCWEAIADLPMLEGTTGARRSEYADVRPTPFISAMRGRATVLRDHEALVLGYQHAELVRHVPPGGTWRDIPPHLLPDRFRGMRRTDSSNLIGRLDPALPAYTITTQFNNVTVGCFTHPFEDRALSVREAARLQTFPDRYRFAGSITSRARQIGNAVPPHLAAVLAYALGSQIWPDAPLKPVRTMKPAAVLPAPPATTANRNRLRAQKRVDTKPEMMLRAALGALGVSDFETNSKPEPEVARTADIVFRSERVAVFVDGCFWHGCPTHSRDTKSNTKWWKDKIDANRSRDVATTSKLTSAGWEVVRVWEHEDPTVAASAIWSQLNTDGGRRSAAAM